MNKRMIMLIIGVSACILITGCGKEKKIERVVIDETKESGNMNIGEIKEIEGLEEESSVAEESSNESIKTEREVGLIYGELEVDVTKGSQDIDKKEKAEEEKKNEILESNGIINKNEEPDRDAERKEREEEEKKREKEMTEEEKAEKAKREEAILKAAGEIEDEIDDEVARSRLK